MTGPDRRSPRLLVLAAIGIALFAGGVTAALMCIPEWRNRDVSDHAFFARRLHEVARDAGLEIESEPRTKMQSEGWIHEQEFGDHESTYEFLGTKAADWLAREGRGPFVDVTARSRWTGGELGDLHVLFSTRGVPVAARWTPSDPFGPTARRDVNRASRRQALARMFAPSGAAPREIDAEVFGQIAHLTPIPHTNPPETLLSFDVTGIAAPNVQRVAGSVEWWRLRIESLSIRSMVTKDLPRIVIVVGLYLGTLGLFIVLLARRRIELSKGAILAAISIALSIWVPLRTSTSWLQFIDEFVDILAKALALFMLWSAAESWLRSTVPGFRTSLDTLRAGRLGPKGGRALLAGWSIGAAAAGVGLMALAIAPMFEGVAPDRSSIRVPIFSTRASPIDEGAIRTGLVILAICTALRLPVIRRIRGTATTLAGLLLATQLPLTGFWFAVITGIAVAFVLARGYAAFGLTALVAASLTSTVLPATAFSLIHAEWLTPSAIFLLAVAIAPVIFGSIGIRRSPEIEEVPHAAPAFVRRLETESRLKHEMDLLARMQLGLLPKDTPKIDGYEIAARSILATEAGGDLYDFVPDAAGRLWIAAGDVSGHGYSCAIAQAMTKAGLASLVEAERTPAMVLDRLDRVLRGIGSSRTFTTLALLRLDPESGHTLISNAGHPYPWIVSSSDACEVELPSLPLGQGPTRTYTDTTLTLEPGMTLVLSSDGLFEGTDASGRPYGFDRMRPLLRKIATRPAEAILTAIVDDWREHVGADAPPDDTTIVVVKRR